MAAFSNGSVAQAAPDLEFGCQIKPQIDVKMLRYAQVFSATRIFSKGINRRSIGTVCILDRRSPNTILNMNLNVPDSVGGELAAGEEASMQQAKQRHTTGFIGSQGPIATKPQ
jgi:hypothetical protein